MKIKRYTAASMRAALDQARAEQGPDAVILSSRRTEEGVEVIAAVDYDEALIAAAVPRVDLPPPVPPDAPQDPPPRAAARAKAAAASAAPLPARPRPAEAAGAKTAAASPAARPTALSRPAEAAAARPGAGEASAAAPRSRYERPAPAAPAPSAGIDPGGVQRELQGLRRLLESELAALTWTDKRLREPHTVRVLEELSALDIAPDIAAVLAARVPPQGSFRNPAHIPLALLVKHLPVVNDPTCVTGGILAVVGPTGVGKTTTIAKLAARWSLRHGSEEMALVSTDGYRIGAREQLLTYARILGAPLYAANDAAELARILDRLSSKKLVLIDTAGIGPRDVRLAEQLAALKLGAARARVMLALPAQGELHALEEIVRAFAHVAPAACILTKMDEAASLGAVISTVLRHQLPVAYVCDGQRVPEDLHTAHARRVWLLRTAAKLKEAAPTRRDDHYFARNFGRSVAHG